MRKLAILAATSIGAAVIGTAPAVAAVNVQVTTGNPLSSKIYDINAGGVTGGFGSLTQNNSDQDVILTPNTAVDIADGFSTIKEFVAKKDTAPLDWTSMIVDPNVDYSAIQYSIQLEGDGTVFMYYLLAGSNTFSLFGSFSQDHDKHVQYLMDGGTFDALKFVVTGTTFKEVKQISIDQLDQAVPEPGTWALMLAGFGATGFALRRSRRRKVLLTQAA